MSTLHFRTCFMLATALLLTQAACKKKPDPEPEQTDTFDRSAMLQNYTQQLILPAYAALDAQLDTLQTDASAFIAAPNTNTLNTLRNTFKRSYKRWMHCSMFEFGPAYNILLRTSVNTFPCDTPQVNYNINAGTYDLTTPANIDAIGYPALDFMLYGCGSNTAGVLSRYTTDAQAAGRKTYLNDIITDLRNKVSYVYTAWTSGYSASFQANTATSTGAPISDIVNQLNYDFEITKNARVGIPLGKQSLGVQLPEKCEALYSGYSLTLIKEHVAVLEDFYLGRSETGSDGSGLADYLDHLGAQYNGGSLNTAIQNKFAELKAALNAIPETLAQSVTASQADVETAYQKFQQLVIFLKTDMPSALSILITYADADGD